MRTFSACGLALMQAMAKQQRQRITESLGAAFLTTRSMCVIFAARAQQPLRVHFA
jgi:hypothetical protein